MSKTLFFTVTNDLTYDQRMQRICGTLAAQGYDVVLVGRAMKGSLPLLQRPYKQIRLRPFFSKGKAFYAEYNIRLFLWLMFKKMDAICAIDLDTIMPCLLISKMKRIPRVYDAHELFTELKEVVTRPAIHRFWSKVERYAVPRFKTGYTVNASIAAELQRRYGVHYGVIRNLPKQGTSTGNESISTDHFELPKGRFILYQGAVNEGRGFETLIPAMKQVHAPLVIAGEGNMTGKVKELIQENGVGDRVHLLGMVPPDALRAITPKACFGLTLFEETGLNQSHSLANRFFDYIQAGIPQVCVAYPEYSRIIERYKVAALIKDIQTDTLVDAMNNLLADDVLYHQLKENCSDAAAALCWEHEERSLVSIWQQVLGG